MTRLITLATVLLVGLASVQAAQTDDQQKKKKKKAQTTQTAKPAAKAGATQTSKKDRGTQTSNQQVVRKSYVKPGQTSNQQVVKKSYVKPGQTSNQQVVRKSYVKPGQTSNQQVVKKSYVKPGHSNAGAAANYNQRNTQVVQTKKSKNKNQNYVVTNNNAQWNKKAWKHYKRTGNEWSYSAAQRWNWREHHNRDWWRRNNYRLVRYGGGYWYWNSGWWYPAYGYDPYYSHYVYDGPIFGYGYAAPGDVTVEVQRALAQQGYYYGPIDGILGPGTRSAIQRYQIDHGLAVTATIDEQTLATLGMT
jgi:hypothetical protein